jgi:hypothetical protein
MSGAGNGEGRQAQLALLHSGVIWSIRKAPDGSANAMHPQGRVTNAIYCPPKEMHLTVDFYEYLVEMPTPATRFYRPDPALSDLDRNNLSELMPPELARLVAYIDATFVQQILTVS